MCIGYRTQSTITALTTTALQSSYQDAVSFTAAVGGMANLVLYVTYTTGAAETNNSIEAKFETGPTSSDLYRMTTISTSGGTITLTQNEYTLVGASAATAYKFQIPIEIADTYLKVSFKETGVAANAGSVKAVLTTSGI